MSHEVTLRWRLELGSSENLLHSCVVSGLKRLKKTGTAKAPHASLSLCSFSPWYLQRGGFRVARFFYMSPVGSSLPRHISWVRESRVEAKSPPVIWPGSHRTSFLPLCWLRQTQKCAWFQERELSPHLSVEKCHCHAVRVRWGTWYSCLWKICSVRYQGRGVNLVPGIDQPGHWSWGSWTSGLS